MTRTRLATLLALPALALAAVPASADGARDAATTSFLLRDGRLVQEVDLVAVRDDDRDVLRLRISSCGDHSCAGEEQRVLLDEGQLMITERTASLRVLMGGRDLQVTWSLGGDGFQLSGARVRSDGLGGQSTADTFAGRTADVQVRFDGAECATSGAIGTAVRLATADRARDVSLGAGALECPNA